MFQGMGFVKNRKIVREQIAVIIIAEFPERKEGEEQGVVKHHYISLLHQLSCLLIEAVAIFSTGSDRADTAIATNLRPNFT